MKKIIFWLIVIFTILSLTSVAYAHQYPFHKDVTVKSMERKVKEHAPSSIDYDFNFYNYFGIYDPIKDEVALNSYIKDFLELGSLAPDRRRFGDHKLGSEAEQLLEFYYNRAIWYWQNGNRKGAIYRLGSTAHMLEDQTSPDHVNGIHLGEFEGFEVEKLGNVETVWSKYAKTLPNNIDITPIARNHLSIWPTGINTQLVAPTAMYYIDSYSYKYKIPVLQSVARSHFYNWLDYSAKKSVSIVAGLINRFWEDAKLPRRRHPGSDNPDDNYSASSANITPSQGQGGEPTLMPYVNPKYLRIGLKKGKTASLAYKTWADKMLTGFESTTSVSVNDINLLANVGKNINALAEKEFKQTPDVAIIKNGFYQEMNNLVQASNEPVKLVANTFSPAIAKDISILIIPSGGLYGLSNSPEFKARIA